VIAVTDGCQSPRDVVSKVVVGEIEEIGFTRVARARPRIDRYPESLTVTFEQDVIVRTHALAFRPPVDDSAAEDAVAPDCHADHPAPKDNRRANSIARRPFCRIGQEGGR
jgi:hypothetical protein